MKKSMGVVVFLAAAMVLSSCSMYTCPTYAKQPPKPVVKASDESRI